jgi:6-phosphogluconolactonase
MLVLLLSCAHPPPEVRPAPEPESPAPAPDAPTAGSTGSTGETGTAGGTGDTATPPAPRLFAYVGAADDQIHVYTVDPVTGALAAVSATPAGSGPSFLAFSPDLRHLYAVNEGADELAAFSVDGGTGGLTLLNRVAAGEGPAHLTVDATGRFVLAADYGGGDVTVNEVLADGSLGARVAALDTGPNAHQIVLDPQNRYAFVPNLGSDEVSQLVFDPVAGALVPNAVPAVGLPAGSGPRHIALHPTAPFAYVIGEIGDTMTALSLDAATGRMTALDTVSTLPPGVDGDDSHCAEVAFGAGGRFLYGSNRGHDSLVVYEVDAATGTLSVVGHPPTGGSWPRHFGLSPDGGLLLVANQRSDTVVSFRIDPAAGTLTELATTPTAPGPAFVGVVDLPPG